MSVVNENTRIHNDFYFRWENIRRKDVFIIENMF
jgi:hypothetical protein